MWELKSEKRKRTCTPTRDGRVGHVSYLGVPLLVKLPCLVRDDPLQELVHGTEEERMRRERADDVCKPKWASRVASRHKIGRATHNTVGDTSTKCLAVAHHVALVDTSW